MLRKQTETSVIKFILTKALILLKVKMNAEYYRIIDELKISRTTLVAVSKTKPVEAIMDLYRSGQHDFGENKVQELREKQAVLPKDIRWHLIGHLQTNKVKYIAPWIHLIHSADSLELLKEINKQAEKNGRVVDCLLQIFIAAEETKFGLNRDELFELLNSESVKQLNHIRICGLMGMATNTDNFNQVRNEFMGLKNLFDELKRIYFADAEYFKEISMGMSSDYKIAIEEGATIVRIGSLLFGERN